MVPLCPRCNTIAPLAYRSDEGEVYRCCGVEFTCPQEMDEEPEPEGKIKTLAGRFEGKSVSVKTLEKNGARWSNFGYWVFSDGSQGYYLMDPKGRGVFHEQDPG